jgi:hypothetical protein
MSHQTDTEKELEAAEQALRLICIAVADFDPSDGEGTSPEEVVELVEREFKALRQRNQTLAKQRRALLRACKATLKWATTSSAIPEGQIPFFADNVVPMVDAALKAAKRQRPPNS